MDGTWDRPAEVPPRDRLPRDAPQHVRGHRWATTSTPEACTRSYSDNRKGNTMSTADIIRAWKDADYRQSLGEEQRSLLPQHPAGLIELADSELDAVAGGLPRRTDPNDTCFSLCSLGCPATYACWP